MCSAWCSRASLCACLQERERVCNLQSKVSSLDAAEHKRKEREREASKESSAREDRISRMQTELDKKVCIRMRQADKEL